MLAQSQRQELEAPASWVDLADGGVVACEGCQRPGRWATYHQTPMCPDCRKHEAMVAAFFREANERYPGRYREVCKRNPVLSNFQLAQRRTLEDPYDEDPEGADWEGF